MTSSATPRGGGCGTRRRGSASGSYRPFDIHELRKVAAKSVGAEKCVSVAKLAEGGFSKVFRLVMNDGSAVIARVPNPNAGSRGWTTASEVATMDFALSILGLPVPKALVWSIEPDNPVQGEYIVMEEATRTQLRVPDPRATALEQHRPCPIAFMEAEISAQPPRGRGAGTRARTSGPRWRISCGKTAGTAHETYDEAVALSARLREEGLQRLEVREGESGLYSRGRRGGRIK